MHPGNHRMSVPRDFSSPAARDEWSRDLLQLQAQDETRFIELARELFAFQFQYVPAYRRLCTAHRLTPEIFTDWRDLPAVPQQLFKHVDLFAHPSQKPAVTYETSGTTTGQPGRQHLLSTDVYQTISVEGARRAGLFKAEPRFLFLVPSATDAPHSSLSAMFDGWRKAFRQPASCFWVRKGRIDFVRLRAALTEVSGPIALCGTAFNFVHLLDAWADLAPLRLPRGSWLLETGGFKGRSREIAKPDLYAQLVRMFSIPDSSIWNEYGMSELSSQAYAHGTSGLHETPPWARVLVCDPVTGREVPEGQSGLVRWIDLANVDSILSLQTLDLAERTLKGFRLVGRLPRTEPRGCSLGAEDLALQAAV